MKGKILVSDKYLSKIERVSVALEELKILSKEIRTFEEYQSSLRTKASVERFFHIAIEGLLDLIKMIVTDMELGTFKSNYEAVQLLVQNKLLAQNFLSLIKKIIGLRNIIVHEYDKIDDEIIYSILKKNLKDLEKIFNAIKSIINQYKI